MNGLFPRIRLALKALGQLGFRQVGLYTWYQLELRSGYLRWRTPAQPSLAAEARNNSLASVPLFTIPGKAALTAAMGEAGARDLLTEADEIVAGRARLFGGPAVAFRFDASAPLKHWTAYAKGENPEGIQDIKFIWEPARFGWAFTLGRAYCITDDERYPAAFWVYAEDFLQANPVNLGPHWASAQEVALRLMAFAFALQAFATSAHTSPERADRLSRAIAEHAARIPATLAYARAQNNNHLLSEAAGLYTAGVLLPHHPASRRWRVLGWRWLNRGLQNQIAPDGAYAQHSANYHRLMLQIALWVQTIAARQGQKLPEETRTRLSLATCWLLALVNGESGQTPNLGPNDGAYILPLSTCPFPDYRPVLQAASALFLGERPYGPGPWDEMALWLPVDHPAKKAGDSTPAPAPHELHFQGPGLPRSWAYLRVARFTSRPGHADQLHLDLWWRGLNIAQDAGTYRYNAPPPWDNSLAQTTVHNTVSVDGLDQMSRAGRFLFLDWAQAQITGQEQAEDGSWKRLIARHDGYRRLGIIHQRAVTATRQDGWTIEDSLIPAAARRTTPQAIHSLRLHWLLPDWPWEAKLEAGDLGGEVMVYSPFGWVKLSINDPLSHTPQSPITNLILSRAGEQLFGTGDASPIHGWVSPTYGVKVPALSLLVEVKGVLPLSITSQFTFPA